MAFCSKNEIDKFSYRDELLREGSFLGSSLTLQLEALIVLAANSQNTNYTDSYAGDASFTIQEAEMVSCMKEGYRHYNANDVLIEEVPDSDVPVTDELTRLLFHDTCLIGARFEDGRYYLEIEIPDEDPSAITDVYELCVSGSQLTVTWERYLNRVQN